jgi:DNA-binding LacI/PurR family transcriptional regulator
VTIREVAKDAGVGIATVSRALNNSGYVADDARARIVASVERLGYRPSERARSLRSLRTRTLCVLMPELANPVYLEFLRGVEEVAHRNGYVTLIGNSHYEVARETAILERMMAERVDGLVVGTMVGDPRQLKPVAEQGIAIAPPRGPAGRKLDWAWDTAESAATEAMARRLLALGHREVALVSVDPGSGVSPPSRYRRSRSDVIARVVAEAGAALRLVVIPRGYELPDAARIVADTLGQASPASAYIASSHLIAPAVLYGLKAAGAGVPRDVSFVTYGDSDWAAAYRPALSAISHDIYGEGVQLAEMLLDVIQHGATRRTVSYQAHFIERESCGPAPPPS